MSVSAAALLVKMAGAWEARGGDLAAVGDVLREAAVSIRAISAPATTGAPTCQWQDPPTPQDAGGGYCGNPMPCSVHGGATTVGEGPPAEGELVLQMERSVHVLAAISLKGGMRDPWLRERCSQASAVLKAVRFPDDPWPSCFDSLAERADRAAPPSPPKGGEAACGDQDRACTCTRRRGHGGPHCDERWPGGVRWERPRPESAEAKVCEACGGTKFRNLRRADGPCPSCGGTGRAP